LEIEKNKQTKKKKKKKKKELTAAASMMGLCSPNDMSLIQVR